jgi:predicted AlkP superfamily phosphohydrolase/phosphomutase
MLALLQFDSAALPVVERMLDQGRLPTLEALRGRGHWQALEPPASLFQSATYPTLYTGMEVGEHGLYSAFPWSGADQRVRFMHTFPTPETIWDRLTVRGRRSLVIDPYLAWPPGEMRGIFLSGWHFTDRMVMQGRSVPRSRRWALARRYGRPPALSDVYGRQSASSLLAWRDHLVRGPARTANAVSDLIQKERFDLVWINFSAAHKAGHHFWDPISVIAEELDESSERVLREGLEDVYVAVDEALGQIVDALPDDADLIVLSPTGMGPNTSRADLLPGMLDAILSNGQPRESGENGSVFSTPVWALRARVPVSWRRWIANALPDRVVADMTTRLYIRADWQRTRAMAVPGECHGYVRLNLRGRERDGIVDPADADEVMTEVGEGLTSFQDPDGSPVVVSVERAADLTGSCPCARQLPDLVVRWSDRPATGVTAVSSPRHGRVERRGVGSGRSGHHTDDAWALLLPGAARRRELGRPARLTDIGATVCGLLDADPTGISGDPLLEAG